MKLFTPASAIVGTSGSCGARLALVTASARSLPRLDLRDRGADRVELRLHLTADEVLNCAAPSAIGHVRVRRADLQAEHHGAQVRRGADAARRRT